MSTWDAEPSKSRWYGEIIYDFPDGGECDYSYGYSSEEKRPALSSLRELLPEGRVFIERKIKMTPGHPRWKPSKEEDDHG